MTFNMRYLAIAGLWQSTTCYMSYLFVNKNFEAALLLGLFGSIWILIILSRQGDDPK